MNKKIIVALICVSIIAISAIPAMGNVSNYNDTDAQLTANNKDITDDYEKKEKQTVKGLPGDPVDITLNVTIESGLSRGIYFNIDNTGEENASNVNYSITVSKRGLLKRVILDKNGSLSLDFGLNETIEVTPFGIGRILVTVNVTVPGNDPIVITATGLILFKFVFLFKSE